MRAELGLLEDEAAATLERDERAKERVRLLAALRGAGVPERDVRGFDEAAARPDDRETLAEIALSVNRFLARSPSRLLMVQLEDLLGDVEQINMPTTTDEHPDLAQAKLDHARGSSDGSSLLWRSHRRGRASVAAKRGS